MNRKSVTANGLTVTLTDKEFKASGGQGDIYIKSGTVYKIYHDLATLIPEQKITELKRLDSPTIIVPQDIIRDAKGKYIGFTMRLVDKADPLCKLFTNAYWTKFSFTPDLINELLKKFIANIQFIHGHKCLIVDLNEFNFMVDTAKFVTPYHIDVDNYQTPHFPTQAIMPNIRDFHAKQFSELTDWYSFAILACQLYVGIHPFKGSHPSYTGKQLEQRMRDNVSIFNNDVSLPQAARDFALIPANYKEWFVKLFEKGDRVPPPDVFGTIIPVVQRQVQSTTFSINQLYELAEEIMFHCNHNGTDVFKTKKYIYFGSKRSRENKDDVEVAFTDRSEPVFVYRRGDSIVIESDKKVANNQFKCSAMFVYEGEIYIKNGDKLINVGLTHLGETIVGQTKFWNIMELSTEVYSGLCISQIFRDYYLYIPVKTTQTNSCHIVTVKELSEYKIVNAKRCKNVVAIIGFKNGKYDKLIIKFSADFSSFEVRKIEDIQDTDINFTVLDNGITVMINDTSVDLFFSALKNDTVKSLNDKTLDTSLTLSHIGSVATLTSKRRLYKISLK